MDAEIDSAEATYGKHNHSRWYLKMYKTLMCVRSISNTVLK
jgi:hypothetical protein